MKRNEFFKMCGAGICGCGVLGLLAPLAARADDATVPAAAAAVDPELLKQQLEGARERFARLLSVMDEQLDEATRGKILQGMGRECSREYSPFFNKYRGDLQGFLEKIKTAWVERTEYDEKTGILLTVGRVLRMLPRLDTGRLFHRAGQAGDRRDRGIGPARRFTVQFPHRHQGVRGNESKQKDRQDRGLHVPADCNRLDA
jgi:hypothetical protein